jgi:hypothetical protein
MKNSTARLILAGMFLLSFLSIAFGQNVPPNNPATPVVSTTVQGFNVLKASPGNLYALYVTSGATAGFLMTFNSTSAPSDGAVTPINCVAIPTATTLALSWAPQPPERYSTGITAVFSTTGCFTKTISNTAFFHALVQ